MEDEVSSSDEAWSSVRMLRSVLPWAISALALATPSALVRTPETTRSRFSCIAARACSRRAGSSLPSMAMVVVRSPAATLLARDTATRSGPTTERVSTQPANTPSALTSASATRLLTRARRASCAACWAMAALLSATWRLSSPSSLAGPWSMSATSASPADATKPSDWKASKPLR